MRKIVLFFFLFFFPLSVFAYSNRIAVGGETIGIEVHSNGIYVVGFYEVNGKKIAQDAGFQVGDIIQEINHKKVQGLYSFDDILTEEKEYVFTVLRNQKYHDISLLLRMENQSLQTGLYVKDTIQGIGTLSYIDPDTKIFGSLGHEILETSSYSKFLLKEGNIYKAEVSSIKKSVTGMAGEKNAKIFKNQKIGSVNRNEIDGIFGKYDFDISDRDFFDIALKSEIHKGDAYLRTVIKENEVHDYLIHILSIDEGSDTKNLLFEIVDDDFIKRAGGIVQGMSGSPILQDGKIIGVVNYVIVDDVKKGYGIFIQTMLEEGDKVIS